MSTTDPMFDETDLDNPNYYCVHGTFTGNPYGADYMCGFCEDGTTPEEYEEHLAYRARCNRNRRLMSASLAVIGSPRTPKKLTDHETSLIVGFVTAASQAFR